MKKLYILESDNELFQYYVYYNEKNLQDFIYTKEDYLPNLDSISRMIEYYKKENRVNYVQDNSDGMRVLLNYNPGIQFGDDIVKLFSTIKFEKGKIISLKDMRIRIEENIKAGYDLYKNKNLSYGLKDYQYIILAHVDTLFDEYKTEALQNTKILAKSFMKR